VADATQLCTFYADGLYFGIDVREVQEVLQYQDMVRVPLAADVVRGLINLRGQIVTAIDLRRRLDLAPREDGIDPMNVVVRSDDGAVSLLVDEIGDVVEVDERTYERAPATLTGRARELIDGVFKLDGQLLLVLDAQKAIDLPLPRHEDG
jgi:purine-binding chemotaxis protein CheW